jgi:pimeloyl-ACP methyl ester carboxylesterase
VLRFSMIAALLLSLLPAAAALAQSAPRYIPLGPADAALYPPDSGPAPHVGVLVVHRTSNFIRHPACTELSKRGFMVLCVNTRYINNEMLVNFEEMALDVKAGVAFLKRQPGITKVLLFGHSGGGPTTSFYQAVAENGTAYCKDPDRIVKCTDELAGLPAADGIVFADSHPGNPVNVLRGLNPSVIDERNPPAAQVRPELDPFDPKNGFNPQGNSNYSAEFQQRYYTAQSRRMNALIDDALAKLARMKRGDYTYPDDDIIVIPRGGNPGAGPGAAAALFDFDANIPGIFSTVRPEKLLRNDGSVVTQPVSSVWVASPNLVPLHRTFDGGTKVLTIRSFLSANAVRSTNSLDGIDDCSSNNDTLCAVRSIHVPELFVAMGAHYFVRDVEHEFDLAATRDKEFIVIEGAVHGFTPCTRCEKTPGQYANSEKNFFDYVAAWINKRF